jgi:hypothetical protein
MEETKEVYVVLSYSMRVPEDMTKEQIQEALYGQFQAQSDSSIILTVDDYNGEGNNEPVLMLDDVFCGESLEIKIG